MEKTITRQLGMALLGLIAVFAILMTATSVAAAQTATSTTGTSTTRYVFDAALSGTNEVPPVATTSTSTASTTGHSRVWFDETTASSTGTTTTTMMWNVLHVWNGNDIWGAHLHCGLPGQNGPVVVSLFHTATTSAVDVNGTLVGTSTIGDNNITATTTGCSMPIRNVSELAAALKAGIIYANVHSVEFPNGVARGQLMLTASSTSHSSTTTPPNMCTNNSSNGWYDTAGKWHSCGSGGNNGDGTCPNGLSNQGWYDSSGNWHWCSPNGGTTTPPIPGIPGGLGEGISGMISRILGNVQHILNTFLPTGTDTPALRSVRTMR